ncbi:hypothetical protein FRC11_001400 [Ceratobasidium sp. 423]|nr:hypothetical protein FRC11_001400 [Ceratobasidium sp. 423]
MTPFVPLKTATPGYASVSHRLPIFYFNMSSSAKPEDGPVFKPPTSPPKEWTVEELQNHLQSAVKLELTTIPLYLFAMYSINRDSGDSKRKADAQTARDTIHKIVLQEMLHLALAGNCLTAVRGRPRLYGDPYTPTYPTSILYEQVKIDLDKASPDNIQSFINVEKPEVDPCTQKPPIKEPPPKDPCPVDPGNGDLSDYKSIGDFYTRGVECGFKAMYTRLQNDLFDQGSGTRQWAPDDGYFSELAVIMDEGTALNSLNLIIYQGEGGPDYCHENNHYEMFKTIKALEYDTYDVIKNPVTKNYKDAKGPYSVMLACDTAYSYLLKNIEIVWAYGGAREGQVKNNLHALMGGILDPLASFLVKQTLKDFDNKQAAPPFNVYPFSSDSSPKAQLKERLQDAVNNYPGQFNGVLDAVDGLYDIGDA